MRYPERTKQAAYEIYRGDPKRPLSALAEDLAALPDGEQVPVDTLLDWRNRYTWDARIQLEIAEASPILLSAHVSLARVAGFEGLTYLRDVANGKQAYDKQRVEVAKFLVEEVRPMLKFAVSEEAPVPIQPAQLAGLTRAGAPLPSSVPIFAAMTNDELQATEHTPGWTD